jgi:predicted NBD/HSP70 family sugar kinase
MYFACDIGGTKTRIAGSKDCMKFDNPVIVETPDNPEDGLELIINTIKGISDDVTAVAVGIAGVLDQSHSYLIKSPHLGAWEKIPIREKLEKELDTKVHLENDTDIVGLGEALSGAGRGHRICVYITVSTGIGGVKVSNGKFEENRYGFEPGFQILNNETGENWEDLCSGTAVEKKYGMHPMKVAKTADWDSVEENVAIGLHNSILHWSPDVVVLGGAMSRDFDVERIREKVRRHMKIHPKVCDIKIAELGSIGGIHGGFAFLRGCYNL